MMCPSFSKKKSYSLKAYFFFSSIILSSDYHVIIASLSLKPVIHQNLPHPPPYSIPFGSASQSSQSSSSSQSLMLHPLMPVTSGIQTMNPSPQQHRHSFSYPSSHPFTFPKVPASTNFLQQQENRKDNNRLDRVVVECFSFTPQPQNCFFKLDNCLNKRNIQKDDQRSWEKEWNFCSWRDKNGSESYFQRGRLVCCFNNRTTRPKIYRESEQKKQYENEIKLKRLTAIFDKVSRIPKSMRCGKSVLPSAWNHQYHSRSPIVNEGIHRVKRIVHGISTSSLSHPWLVSIYYRGRFTCGGSIISERIIVTTAHCVRKGTVFPSKYEVMIGSTRLGWGVMHDVKKIIPHPEYRKNSVYNDIALVFTKLPMVFTESVQPICLPDKTMNGQTMAGMTATMAGFGTLYYGGPLPDILQETQVRIQNNRECNDVYRQLSHRIFTIGIPPTLICTSSTKDDGVTTTDACVGDSGGPLLVTLDGRAILIGVITFGYKCSEDGYSGVSTTVSHFSTWMSTVIRKEIG